MTIAMLMKNTLIAYKRLKGSMSNELKTRRAGWPAVLNDNFGSPQESLTGGLFVAAR